MSNNNLSADELARESAKLHEAIDASSRINPDVDQFEAGCREARRLAPNNRFLRSNPKIQSAIHHALTHLDRDVEVQGTVLVIRLRPLFAQEGSAEHLREGSEPIADRAPARYCSACYEQAGRTVPFWLACGTNIVQIDMCGDCADHYVFDGAIPQVGGLD